ncbi:ArnT family glycosyltransferase [Paludisphaera borealis]|uniref:GT83 family glycosyltransferase n=1 Tax=Paludisphaera borealis TaxID=1387353 RepID=A0A1U7CWC2_9BACT|nr:glycosyltransferase family 39 protein [Paludisphaera borealis]APW63189.1 GT83 family glycosyltransferase [Paludisphaera borealis]
MGQDGLDPIDPTTLDDARAMRISWREPALIVIVCLILFLAGNARTGLWDRDEPRNAVAVHEMRARGDWLFPSFNGEPRYHKPILIYWLMGVSTAVFGENPAAARLPSALAGTGVCLLTWLLGRRMFGPRVGFFSALMLAVAPIMVAESKLATTDATLTLWLTGCQLCLWELSRRDAPRLAATFWVLLSLATLTKGPVGPALLAMTGLFAWWWGCPAAAVWRRLHPRRGLIGFALLTAPWYLVALLGSNGRFFQVAVNQQLVQRVATGMEQHGAFPGYYAALSLLVFFPWSCLVPMAVLGAWRRRKVDRNLGFLLAWVVGPMILLECVQTKLIHYYLPAYPACALLAAWVVVAASREEVTLRRWTLGRLGQGLIAGIGLTVGVGMTAAAIVVSARLRLPLITCGAVVSLGTLASLLQLQRGATQRGTFGLIATTGGMMLILAGWLIPSAESLRVSRIVGERLAALEAETGFEPLLMNYQEPGVIYAIGKPVAAVRDPQALLTWLDEKKAMITAVTPEELELLSTNFGVALTPLEEVKGFNPARGTRYKLLLAVVRRAVDAPRPDESTARAGGDEQTLVK